MKDNQGMAREHKGHIKKASRKYEGNAKKLNGIE